MESENMFDTVANPLARVASSDTGATGSFPVWVGSLEPSVVEDDLTASFEQFGRIASTKLMRDLKTMVSRNFGYVNFACEKDAFRAAQQMDGALIKGQIIKTKDPNLVRLMKRNRETKDSRQYCRDELKRGGCGRGDSCKYLHIAVDGPPDDGQIYGGSQAMMGGGRYDMHGGGRDNMYAGGRDDFMPQKSTEYCRDEQKPRGCGRGDSCQFLHVAVDGPPSQGGMPMNDGFNQGFNPMAMPPIQYNNPLNDPYGMMEPAMKRTAAMGAMAEEKYKEQRDELRNKVIDLRDMNEKLTDLNKQLRDRLDERLKILATYEPMTSSAPVENLQRKDRDADLFDDKEPTRQEPTRQEVTNDVPVIMRDYGHGYGL